MLCLAVGHAPCHGSANGRVRRITTPIFGRCGRSFDLLQWQPPNREDVKLSKKEAKSFVTAMIEAAIFRQSAYRSRNRENWHIGKRTQLVARCIPPAKPPSSCRLSITKLSRPTSPPERPPTNSLPRSVAHGRRERPFIRRCVRRRESGGCLITSSAARHLRVAGLVSGAFLAATRRTPHRGGAFINPAARAPPTPPLVARSQIKAVTLPGGGFLLAGGALTSLPIRT